MKDDVIVNNNRHKAYSVLRFLFWFLFVLNAHYLPECMLQRAWDTVNTLSILAAAAVLTVAPSEMLNWSPARFFTYGCRGPR